MARGVDGRAVFLDDSDRELFLRTIFRIKTETPFSILAYCLMGNHFHLAIRVEQSPLSRIMQRILTSYVISFNHRHERQGHLFQARYKAIPCLNDSYLAALVRYIHMNPVRSGIASEPGDWPWSSHRQYISNAVTGYLDTRLIGGILQASGDTMKTWCSQRDTGFVPWPADRAEPIPLVFQDDPREPPDLGELARQLFPMNIDELRSSSRRREIVGKRRLLARQAIESGHSLVSISRWLGCTVGAVHNLCRRNN